MDVDIVHKDFKELSDTGLLWLINRVVFHPRGYKLALMMNDEMTEVEGWTLQGDGSEVCAFDSETDDEEFDKVNRFMKSLAVKYQRIKMEEHLTLVSSMMKSNPMMDLNELREALGLPELPSPLPVPKDD